MVCAEDEKDDADSNGAGSHSMDEEVLPDEDRSTATSQSELQSFESLEKNAEDAEAPHQEGGMGTDLAQQLVAASKRAPRGERCVINGGPEGNAFELLLTYRRPRKSTPYGSYQATCYHHEADEKVGKNGNVVFFAMPQGIAMRKGWG